MEIPDAIISSTGTVILVTTVGRGGCLTLVGGYSAEVTFPLQWIRMFSLIPIVFDRTKSQLYRLRLGRNFRTRSSGRVMDGRGCD